MYGKVQNDSLSVCIENEINFRYIASLINFLFVYLLVEIMGSVLNTEHGLVYHLKNGIISILYLETLLPILKNVPNKFFLK
ncbi:hypothetical protein EZS27_019400 [termite gut metagenome]|uniref:Uncharacterized protein n=1 Tax=termite gut metagenome TaxID=433724 RepID=A0A5J4RFW8_9ZZZZ